jgi:glycosyltransferase involved in cell wall biosynthesis
LPKEKNKMINEEKVSICIAAYNEESGIEGTLDSILSQTYKNIRDVLVCANACTDRTAEIVSEYSRKYPWIKLIETPEAGKPNAWNILRKRAKSKYVIFADGDVALDKEAVSELYWALKETGKIAIGASGHPVVDDTDSIMKMFHSAGPCFQNCLWGGLYGVNYYKLHRKMASIGYSTIPKNVIAEDAWLSLVIGVDNWDNDKFAVFYYRPPSIKDLEKTKIRSTLAVKQLRKMFKKLKWKSPYKGWVGKRMDTFGSVFNPFVSLYSQIMNGRARKIKYDKTNRSNENLMIKTRAISTKKPIPIQASH